MTTAATYVLTPAEAANAECAACQLFPANRLGKGEAAALGFLRLWCEARTANYDGSKVQHLAASALIEIEAYEEHTVPMSPGFLEDGLLAYSDTVPMPALLAAPYARFITRMHRKTNKEYNRYEAARHGLTLKQYLAA